MRVLNQEVVQELGIPQQVLERVAAEEQLEIERRERDYRGGRPAPDLRGRIVILVDDGVATGATVKAAITTLKQERLARLVVALPVASPDAEATIRRMVDEWVCLQAPPGFMAVGSFYSDFAQVEDADVLAMLKDARERRERT